MATMSSCAAYRSKAGAWKMNETYERTFISEIFAYEWIGLRALDERYFEVLYGPVRLGFLDTHAHTFQRALHVALRRRLGLEQPVEMTAGGKPGNPNLRFHLPRPGNRPSDFPHSHPLTILPIIVSEH